MRYAALMRYGGELADAAECSHSDWKYLKPLCPNCREPILLRAGGDRVSSKGTAFKVPAHWAHYPSKDPALAAQCEERVSHYSEEEVKRRSAQARGQRLKLFQRWFWAIVSALPMSDNEGETIGQVIETHWQMYSEFEAYRQHSDQLGQTLVRLIREEDTLRRRIDDVIDGMLAGDYEYLGSGRPGGPPPHLLKYLEDFSAEVDLRLQKQITFEAMQFLASPRGSDFLRALAFNAVIPFADNGLPPINGRLALAAIDSTLSIVGLVRWAEAFEAVVK